MSKARENTYPMTSRKRTWHEDFARFFEAPTRELLREVLRQHAGELDALEFKKEWPIASKLAKSILAMANSHGGCLVCGVKQESDHTFTPFGLSCLRDKADIAKALSPFLPTGLSHDVVDFNFTSCEYNVIAGMKFQVLFVNDDPTQLPWVCCKDGEGVRQGAIYVRRGTNSVEANYQELQRILNRRIETGYSSSHVLELEEHLRQLKSLYAQLQKVFYTSPLSTLLGRLEGLNIPQPNPAYPQEGCDEFIAQCICEKKILIRKVLGLVGSS